MFLKLNVDNHSDSRSEYINIKYINSIGIVERYFGGYILKFKIDSKDYFQCDKSFDNINEAKKFMINFIEDYLDDGIIELN